MEMASDGPVSPPCDSEIFLKGQTICIVDGSSNAVERWVKAVAAKAEARVDWHYFAGRANVLHLGDQASAKRVVAAIAELKSELKGHILYVG